jgi:hypothetical protein
VLRNNCFGCGKIDTEVVEQTDDEEQQASYPLFTLSQPRDMSGAKSEERKTCSGLGIENEAVCAGRDEYR